MRILFALLSLIVGLALTSGGYRLARFIIPVWGFVAGLALGGSVVSDMANASFLGTLLGVIVGLTLGLVFAAFAYLYYAVAIIVLFGGLGYMAGSSFMEWIGFDPGFLSTVIGLALGIIAGLWAMVLDAPKYVLIVFTAVAGAAASIGGVMLLFNQIPLSTFSYSAIQASINNSFVWTMAAIILAVIGIVVQSQTSHEYYLQEWTAGEESHHIPGTPHPTGAH